jgi:hypothetical protein
MQSSEQVTLELNLAYAKILPPPLPSVSSKQIEDIIYGELKQGQAKPVYLEGKNDIPLPLPEGQYKVQLNILFEKIKNWLITNGLNNQEIFNSFNRFAQGLAESIIDPHMGLYPEQKDGKTLDKLKLYLEINEYGRMKWQRFRNYGQRNYSELAIQRYKRILGNALQSREFVRQKQETIIGYGVLNKMTSLGMPNSHCVA